MSRPDEKAPRDPKHDEEIDEASRESFPASDPPSFTPITHPGEPDHSPPSGEPARKSNA